MLCCESFLNQSVVFSLTFVFLKYLFFARQIFFSCQTVPHRPCSFQKVRLHLHLIQFNYYSVKFDLIPLTWFYFVAFILLYYFLFRFTLTVRKAKRQQGNEKRGGNSCLSNKDDPIRSFPIVFSAHNYAVDQFSFIFTQTWQLNKHTRTLHDSLNMKHSSLSKHKFVDTGKNGYANTIQYNIIQALFSTAVITTKAITVPIFGQNLRLVFTEIIGFVEPK